MKLLTVSIAAYNVEAYLEKCLNSLLIPDLQRLEVLIQNDGSKDATARIGEEFEKKYPGVFRLVNKENGGYGSTINNSLSMAEGKYFKQLDGDDWYDTENFAAFVDMLGAVDADCVYSPYTEVIEPDMCQRPRQIKDLTPGFRPAGELMKERSFKQMHALAYRTEFLRAQGVSIQEKCFYTDQEYVIYPLVRAQSVYVWDRPVYCYRLGRDGQSVSLAGLRKHHEDHLRVLKRMIGFLDAIKEEKPAMVEALREHVHVLLWTQFTLYLAMGDRKQELKALDLWLKKEHPELYSGKNPYVGKRLKLLRATGYSLYPWLTVKGDPFAVQG